MEGNVGDEFGPPGWLAAATLGALAGFVSADDYQGYQILQLNQQTAQGNQHILQMEQQLQLQAAQRGTGLGPGEYKDADGTIRDIFGNPVRDKSGRDAPGKSSKPTCPSQSQPRIVQSKGHTLNDGTVTALNNYFGTKPNEIDWGQALENMKESYELSPDFHSLSIFNNGDVQLNQPVGGMSAGTKLGNLDEYIY